VPHDLKLSTPLPSKTFKALHAIWALGQQGNYLEALRQLEALSFTPDEQPYVLHQLGWLEAQSGQSERGERHLREAVGLLSSADSVRVRFDLAVVLQQRGKLLEAIRTLREVLPSLTGHHGHHTWALYNLGTFELLRGELPHAEHYLERAWTLIRKHKAAREYTGLVLLGLSTLARGRGQYALAIERAQRALKHSLNRATQVMTLTTLATAQRLSKQPCAALDTLYGALRLAPEGALRRKVEVHLGIAEINYGDLSCGVARLDACGQELEPFEQTRVLLYRAKLALENGAHPEALSFLSDALKLEQPFVVQDEAQGLSELYAWGDTVGLALPEPLEVRRTTVQLECLGRLSLSVNGQSVPLGDARRAPHLLAYLLLEGPSHWERAAECIFEDAAPEQAYSRIKNAASSLRSLCADSRAVTLIDGVLNLSPDCTWTMDYLEVRETVRQGQTLTLPGLFFGGALYTEWAEEQRDQLELERRVQLN